MAPPLVTRIQVELTPMRFDDVKVVPCACVVIVETYLMLFRELMLVDYSRKMRLLYTSKCTTLSEKTIVYMRSFDRALVLLSRVDNEDTRVCLS